MAPSPPRAYTTLAALLLTVASILAPANPAAAQQTSTQSSLPAPNLTAQAAERAIELNWNAIDGAARYQLWAWSRANDWYQIGGDNLTATTFTHHGLNPGATYYYQIQAVSAGGEEGAWSDRISATVPGGLAATALTAQAGENAIQLRWDPVPGAARYELWYWYNQDTGWLQIGGNDLTATSYTHGGLTPGTTYYYLIQALANDGIEGAWSEQASATVTAAQTPTPTPTPTASTQDAPTPTPTTPTQSAPTSTPTPTPTPNAPPTPTSTVTPTLTPTASPQAAPTPTLTPTASPQAAPTPTLTPTVFPQAAPTPTLTPTVFPQAAPTPTLTPTVFPQAAPTPTLTPTASPQAAPTPTLTPTVFPQAAPTPTLTPTVFPRQRQRPRQPRPQTNCCQRISSKCQPRMLPDRQPPLQPRLQP